MLARAKQLAPEQSTAALLDIETFKKMFPQGYLSSGDIFDIAFGPEGELTISLKV